MKSGKFVNAAIIAIPLTFGSASAQSLLPVLTSGGNLVVARSQIDGLATIFLDTHHPFSQAGLITNWEIYAYSTNPLQLVIFREFNGVISEVARSASVTPVVGYNLFQLAVPILVQAGDFIGANMPGPSGGTIAYSLDALETSTQCLSNFERTTLLNAANSTSFICSSDRTYSIRAFGTL